jgi:chaperonin cofactor prefoldin
MLLEDRKLFSAQNYIWFRKESFIADWRKCAMVEKKLVALSLICVVLFVGFIGAVIMLNQKETEMQLKNNQISGLENEKLTLEAQVATLQFNISGLQSEIVSLKNEKIALENQVSDLQTEATELENEKSTLETQVSTLQANISGLQTEVASLENEVIENFNLGYAEGEAEGYQVGYDEGYAQGIEDLTQSGWYFTDPTYDEAVAFINSDKTNENDWGPDYVCYDFTADFNGNAAQAGYRCGFVYIKFSDSAHAIACFNTTDSGLIYIEPQNDEIVDVAVGKSYLGDIVVKVGIIW